MPSVDDVYRAIEKANVNLQAIDTQIASCCKQTNSNLESITSVLQDISNLEQRTNEVLVHISAQEDTAICSLEKITRQTCQLVNEAHRQAALQARMQNELRDLAQAFLIQNPAAAGELARERGLEERIERCCPPDEEEPVCRYTPCRKPEPIKDREQPG